MLKDGDVVKLDLGVHVDGYIAVVAHTVILSEAKKSRAADALLAAHYCAEAALRLVKPGSEVNQLFKNINKTDFLLDMFLGKLFRTLKSLTLLRKFPSHSAARLLKVCYPTKWKKILSMARKQSFKIPPKNSAKNTKR